MLRTISGQGPEDPDSYLAQHVRSIKAETLPDNNRIVPLYINFDVPTVKQRQLTYNSLPSLHWRMVMTLDQIHYRVSQLEALLESLTDSETKVDFDGTDATREQLEKMILKLANPEG
ncbi:hypothetical protein D3C80_1184930 [compost metagenome]